MAVKNSTENDVDDEPGDTPDETQTVAPANFERIIGDELERQRYGPYTDLNPNEFYASTVGYTPRQMYVKKLGLDDMATDDLGACRVGSLIHGFIEEAITNDGETDLRTEQKVTHSVGDITFRGRYDAYDPEQGIVYDFKSRNGWYKFDPPNQRHVDQLLVYMHALDSDYGQVIYAAKKDLEIKTWPEDGPFHRDDYSERWDTLLDRARCVRDAILEHGVALSTEDIPFEKGDDWLSQQERLAGWLGDS